MNRSLTTLVLTPSSDGDYFGEILAGLAREVVGADSRLIAVETKLASSPRDEVGIASDFSTPVAWSQIDGVVAVTTAVNADYLQELRDAGKPIVLVSSALKGEFAAPAAQPDNRAGTIAAVTHLIEHGHQRIGFVGNIAQRDIRDRFSAYQEALKAYGLTPEPAHMFATPENAESGGALAAQQILATENPPTAVMVGTDRNAIGLMRELTNAGVNIPHDLAVVAFDNIPAGTFSNPSLSSVDQRFGVVGALAGRLIVAKMRGEAVPDTPISAESAVLIPRESCGCDLDAIQTDTDGPCHVDATSVQSIQRDFEEILERDLLSGDYSRDHELRLLIRDTATEAVRLLERRDQATAAEIRSFTVALQQLSSRPDTLRRFTDAMTRFPSRTADAGNDASANELLASSRITAAMWKAQAGALLRQGEVADAAMTEQYAVDAGLVDIESSDPRSLHWLAGTRVKAAALALWEEAPTAGHLRIVGTYGPDTTEFALVDTVVTSETFPPQELIDAADGTEREVCVVVPVRTREQNWGLLAVVADIDRNAARDTYQHWAALLSAALESQRLQEKVRRSALFDALTGLPNRQLFVQQLEHAVALRQREQTPFAVLFLDLDGFKLINDTLGHHMGDRVLQEVASDIAAQLRTVDTAARFGGDEFVILLTDTDPAGALKAAERVQAALAKPHECDGHEVVTRASIGIATSAIDYAVAEEVLRDADSAMYRAKADEPGSIVFFDAPMHADAVDRAALAKDFLHGLQDNQFEVHYQPIVNLASGHTDRFEALVRWRHPARGLLQPEAFLPAMEDTAFIVQLGHWVLAEVCRQLAEWGPKVVNVSINVSDREFWSQDLLSRVLATLEEHHLSPDRITLEITESVLMRRPEMALRMMGKLHEAGLRLHIDDFGTGYSSLETLHRFPVDAFKIDRSFIRTLTNADNSSELIASLVKLGKALGLSVLAEGVETDEQLTSLQELGCATGQGYLFMPAVTGDHVDALLGHSLRAAGSASQTAQ